MSRTPGTHEAKETRRGTPPTSFLRSPSCKGTLPRSEPLYPFSRLRLASTNKPPAPATATVLSRPSNSVTRTSAPPPLLRKQLPRSDALHFAPTPSPPPPTLGATPLLRFLRRSSSINGAPIRLVILEGNLCHRLLAGGHCCCLLTGGWEVDAIRRRMPPLFVASGCRERPPPFRSRMENSRM
jgi:hypothetical protein